MNAAPGGLADDAIASAALALDDPSPAPGERPGLDELWDWTAGAVAPERAREIRAHVARDAELYATWRELRLELASAPAPDPEPVAEGTPGAAPPATSPPARGRSGAAPAGRDLLDALQGWLAPRRLVPAFAAVGALGLALGTLTRTDPPVDPWRDWTTVKGLPVPAPAAERVELDAYLAGVAGALGERGAPVAGPRGEPLPVEMPGCGADPAGGPAACEARRRALHELGRASVAARSGCVADGSPGERAAGRLDVASRALIGAVGAARLEPGLEAWRGAGDDAGRCAAVVRMLDAALEGLERGAGG